MTAPEVAKPYRSGRRLVGFSYDRKTQLASLSAYVPESSGRKRKRKTVFAATYDDAVRLWTAFRERVKNGNLRPAPGDDSGVIRVLRVASDLSRPRAKL